MNIIKQILENKWKKDIETYVRRLLLGAVGTCLYAGYVQKSNPVRVEQTAWWCGLYPDYCMPGAAEKEVRIRFRYLTFLNQKEPEAYIGETDE